MYAETSEEYNIALENLYTDDIASKHQNFIVHLEKSYFDRCEHWASYFRKEQALSTHNVNTNNHIESSFRIMKDQLFNRNKCFNLPDLVDFLLNDESSYYRLKLIDIGNNRINYQAVSAQFSRPATKPFNKDDICEISEGIFMVVSQTKPGDFYMVDMRYVNTEYVF